MKVILAALAATCVLVVPAAASAKECGKTAKLASGTLERLTDEKHLRAGATLRRPDPFHAERAAKIRFGGVVYKVKRGSEFILACFGHTVQQGAIYPRLSLHKGRAKLIARNGVPGAISTIEAMSDPFADRAMRIVVTRRLTKPNRPFGKTTVDKVHGRGAVNITPYVGPKPGTCRQGDGGTFISKKFVGGFFRGSAKYR
jgi:hypothetical protein